MTPQVTMQLALAAPLLGTVLIVLTGHRPNLRETVTLVTAAAMFLLVVSLVPGVMAGGRPEVVFGEMLPGLPIALKLEPLGMTFALIASFLWIVTSIYSIGYMRGHHEENQTQFYAFFAIALFSAIFVAFAGNLLTLFLAYEILSVSTYPLVTHHRSAEAKHGGRVYLGILLTTSIGFFLVAIVWTWLAAGTLDFTDGGILSGKVSDGVAGVLLALYVFGIGKAAVMPFHRWLPAAMVAPTPVSALLHAVAVVKAGVFSVVKVVIYIFGVDFLHTLAASVWLQYAAAATIILASLVALTKDNLKARLAYSTVSQLSYIVLGAMLATEISVVGGGMHIAMHAFGKITLFFCAGAILVATHKTEISQMRGIGRIMPITTFAFLIGSLSIIGLPPFGGMWSKWYLALGALDSGKQLMVAVLMISSLLNIAYLLPIPIRGFFCEPDNNPGHGAGVREAPWPCVLALSVSAVGCLALFFFPEPVYHLLAGMFAR
jgi:multicomponent Na+:H+ antiporter subunit D